MLMKWIKGQGRETSEGKIKNVFLSHKAEKYFLKVRMERHTHNCRERTRTKWRERDIRERHKRGEVIDGTRLMERWQEINQGHKRKGLLRKDA